jgi:hypothetical protein
MLEIMKRIVPTPTVIPVGMIMMMHVPMMMPMTMMMSVPMMIGDLFYPMLMGDKIMRQQYRIGGCQKKKYGAFFYHAKGEGTFYLHTKTIPMGPNS